jgi:ribosomal protein L11 methyltransferase
MGRQYPVLLLTWSVTPDHDRFDRLMADIDGLRATAIEELPDGLRIFFTTPADRDAALPRLRHLAGMSCAPADVPGDDWAARSQAELEPITVGGVTIAPPWAVTPDLPAQSPHLIVIQPSMGFGTGHHASTRLCLQSLQTGPLAGAAVLDVGTGSGVLAIAAWRLGAAVVVGVDVDPDALASARENLDLNGAAGRIDLRELSVSEAAATLGRRFDVIVANLTGGLICREAATFGALAVPGARLIASGFQRHETAQVTGALAEAGWTFAHQAEEQDWVGLVLRFV